MDEVYRVGANIPAFTGFHGSVFVGLNSFSSTMKRLLPNFWLYLFAGFVAFGVAARADQKSDYGVIAGAISVPAGLTANEVQDALTKAADGRGWTLVSRDDEKVIVRLEKNDWVARITMVYNTTEVQFYSVAARKGKPKLPEGWIKYLKEDASRIMGTAAALKK